MSDHFRTTTVTIATCSRCRQLTLTGLAEGLRARVDPTPLNRAGQIAAILAGRTLYALTRTGLVHLYRERIGGHIRGPTIAAHKCGHDTPTEYQAPGSPSSNTKTLEGIPF